jgi:hypothetical protein
MSPESRRKIPHVHRNIPRRTILINPRFQGGAAFCFALAILAAGALFTWFFHLHSKGAFRIASLHAHYNFSNPYEIVGVPLARSLAAMSAGGLGACLLLFLIMLGRVRKGVRRLVEVLRGSAEGDLSTPSNATGLRDVSDLGKKIDTTRATALSFVREAMEEVEMLRNEPLSEEEYARRWSTLKHILRRIAP